MGSPYWDTEHTGERERDWCCGDMTDKAIILSRTAAVTIVFLTASLTLTAAAVTRDVTDTEGSGLVGLAVADPLNLLDMENEDTQTDILKTEELDMETTDEELGDIVITANEPTNTIKEENIFKCQKCLKNQFCYRHDGFCGKCVIHDIIDVQEQEKLNTAIRCKKCQKVKFRSRNTLFCTAGCDAGVEQPKTTKKATTTEKIVVDLERSEEKDEFKKKKEKKKAEREQRRKEKQQRKLEKKRKRFGLTTNFSEPTVQNTPAKDPLDPDVDVWGEILKVLVIANTWE